jgi:polar amino acid transport system substrate-binding protein
MAQAAPVFRTTQPGTVTMGMAGDMPTTNVSGGVPTGIDCDLVALIADRLGLTTTPSLMDFSAIIESIRSERADVMIGNIGWTAKRTNVMLLTDAIYYAGVFVVLKNESPYTSFSVEEMSGKSLGTVTGYFWVPEMKTIPGLKELKLYDTVDACIRDVVEGRVDMAMLDPPIIDYMILQNPEIGIKQVPMKQDPAFPDVTGKQFSVIGMNIENFDLFDAFNDGVKWLWKTGQNKEILAKYGITNPDYLVPPETNPRIGVDRNEQGEVIGPGAHPRTDFSHLFT